VSIRTELNPIFYPRSVAVIGASPDFKRLGYHCMKSLLMSHFPGKIYPIHPDLSEISGFKAYPSIKAVPGKVDLANCCYPTPERAAKAMVGLVRRGRVVRQRG